MQTDAEVKEKVRGWLEQGEVDVFLGYKAIEGHAVPYFFGSDSLEDLEDLVTGPARYPLEKIAGDVLREDPEVTVGILARDCTLRSLNVLSVWNQLDRKRIKVIVLNCCPSVLRRHCDCSYLEPDRAGSDGGQPGIPGQESSRGPESGNADERFQKWAYEFRKCIKCYGCRNICPVCFCKECSLEHPDLIRTGLVPPEVPIFHVIRAVHMAGRCIDCGLCEDACPMNIPLRSLYRKVNEIVSTVFDYQAGTGADQPPFSLLGDEVKLTPKPLEAAGGR